MSDGWYETGQGVSAHAMSTAARAAVRRNGSVEELRDALRAQREQLAERDTACTDCAYVRMNRSRSPRLVTCPKHTLYVIEEEP